jgi:hypothetical protein
MQEGKKKSNFGEGGIFSEEKEVGWELNKDGK